MDRIGNSEREPNSRQAQYEGIKKSQGKHIQKENEPQSLNVERLRESKQRRNVIGDGKGGDKIYGKWLKRK